MATLRHHLETSGETQAAFAQRINIQQGTVSKLARGVMLPSLKLAQKIERATDGQVPVSSWNAIDTNPNQETSHDHTSQKPASDAA
ncbi:helix-turn-helix domain-containing protein [Paracoccus siganidrum]|uniref:XRE family transcriptional regulator n=1 Tax=Paracoccus siganidrum TaxID=1276757 RepID=A0A419A8M1_9RHOB|nr:helix-turn-helix transcriptional regulator [Paracoccus siganidrum]RJL18236.1 XRE family transcriptional regulator [Paracoccus siganidrum]RMC33413.1 hypothetical protein C9E82_13260 [Paracoccus siganidrum]